MPLYEYRCTPCGETQEVLVRAADQARPPACPSCGAPMEKQWAPVAAHTKGDSGGCAAPRGGFS
ncbi:MAG: hypothetical protein Kow0092_02380 [Deferrisomatales bacterium]